MNPAAKAAQDRARRNSGEFGIQQHSAPEADFDSFRTHDENGFYINRYQGGGEVQAGDRVRYRQAAGGALPRSGRWTIGTVIANPDGQDPEQRERMLSVGMNPDEITLLGDDGRKYHLNGHEIEPYDGATFEQAKAYSSVFAWGHSWMHKEAGEAATEIVRLADENPDDDLDSLTEKLQERSAHDGRGQWSQEQHRQQRRAIAAVLNIEAPPYRPARIEDAQPGDAFKVEYSAEGGSGWATQIDRVTKTQAVDQSGARWSLRTGKKFGDKSGHHRLTPMRDAADLG